MRGAGLTPEQRLELIHEKMRLIRVVPTGDRSFDATMTAYEWNDFKFNALRFTPHQTFSRESGADAMMISLQLRGNLTAQQSGREAHISPGNCFFLSTAKPFAIDCDTMSSIALIVPGPLVRTLVPSIDRYTATTIKGSGGPGGLLRRALEALHGSIGSGDADGVPLLAQAIPYLLGNALSGGAQSSRAADLLDDDAGVARIKAVAMLHLSDPELDCRLIAGAADVSVRRVHFLFSREPETFMHWIWSQRLRRARADLRDPAQRGRTISDIAFSWGFSELPHFSRAFRTAFGISPRADRELAAREGDPGTVSPRPPRASE